ncbi:MAG: HDIG domain-containing protein [Prevotellaceae bacterium]|jgi:uncharacterized protein|nr:HDIG domain-containing protein [Prevotellaceae bacterium]
MNPDKIIRQYYAPQPEVYTLLTAHSRAVADKALAIARLCSNNFILDLAFIEEAAMLHDIGIIYTNAPEISCFGTFPYICHGYLGADMLRAEGYPLHALVCERHTGTGLSLEHIEQHALPLPRRDMRPQTMEEQIICFADLFFSKTHLGKEKSAEKVRAKLQKYGDEDVRQFDKWCEMFLTVSH